MSDSKLLALFKGSAVYLCKAAKVLFYSLVTARMEQDRSAGTLSAAVAPPWPSAAPGVAVVLPTRLAARSRQRMRQVLWLLDANIKTTRSLF